MIESLSSTMSPIPPTRSIPAVLDISQEKTSIRVARNELLPLPSEWKSAKETSFVQPVQPNIKSCDYRLKNNQNGKNDVKVISSITLRTGNVQPKITTSEIKPDNNKKSSLPSKLPPKLAPFKLRPWSWFTGSTNSSEHDELRNTSNQLLEDVEMLTTSNVKKDGLKALLTSWGVSALEEKLTFCGIAIENLCYINDEDCYIILGSDVHLLGDMIKFRHFLNEWKADSYQERSTFEKVNVLQILRDSAEGSKIISYYEKQNSLHHKLRIRVVAIILTYTFSKKMNLSRYMLKDIASQICKIFPKEKKAVYYAKEYKKSPTGILVNKYKNMKAANVQTLKETAKAKRTAKVTAKGRPKKRKVERSSKGTGRMECDGGQFESEELLESDVESNGSFDTLTDDVAASVEYLKQDNLKDSTLTMEHWKKSFRYRQYKLSVYETVDEALIDWPAFKTTYGYSLICTDFLTKYGLLSATSLLTKWDRFFENNLDTFKGFITDPCTLKSLEFSESTSQETIDTNKLLSLHHLLIPDARTINGRTVKPSISASKKSFIRIVKGMASITSEMNQRNVFCQEKNIKKHPMIFVVSNKSGKQRYAVGILDFLFTTENLLEAVDAAFKFYKLFKIEFPPESEKVWTFLDKVFYKTEKKQITGSLLSIVSDLIIE